MQALSKYVYYIIRSTLMKIFYTQIFVVFFLHFVYVVYHQKKYLWYKYYTESLYSILRIFAYLARCQKLNAAFFFLFSLGSLKVVIFDSLSLILNVSHLLYTLFIDFFNGKRICEIYIFKIPT